jgi:hypothetical protein
LIKQFKIIGLFLCVVSSLTTQGQAFFNKFDLCDSCLVAGYEKAIINNKNEIVLMGGEVNVHTTSLFLDKYVYNSTNYTTYKYHDSITFGNSFLFQNENNNYTILTQKLIDDPTNPNGTCKSYLIKIDTNFNLYEKKLLSTKKYDSCDFFAKSFFINNQIYTLANSLDSANAYWIKSPGLTIFDTNGNVLKTTIYHLFPNKETTIKGVSQFQSNFYITGYYQVDPDICTNSLESFIIKIDTLGNYITHKTFTQPFLNIFNTNLSFATNRIFITGAFSDTCIVTKRHTKQQNIILDTNLNIISSQYYSNPQEYNNGIFILPRTDSTFMVLALKHKTETYFKDFVFQVCNTKGEIITESYQTIPTDSSIIEHFYNIANNIIFNPNDKGYILVGAGVRLSTNGVSFANTQPWILSVDSNGCVNTGCAVPLNNQEVTKEKQSVAIYPNPSYNGIYYINTTEKITWKIVNIEGKIIAQGNQNNIDISTVATGIYILQIISNNNLQTIKLQKL